jgi:hypothetical protein
MLKIKLDLRTLLLMQTWDPISVSHNMMLQVISPLFDPS